MMLTLLKRPPRPGLLGEAGFDPAVARAAAENLLLDIWDRRLPVDPVRIARLLGMRVLIEDVGDQVAGAIVKHAGRDPVIILSTRDSIPRQRFACAHEIGHFVHQDARNDTYRYADAPDVFASADVDAEDCFANTFAASLLMPTGEVRRLRRRAHSDIGLALRFDVTRDAMGRRLAELGLYG